MTNATRPRAMIKSPRPGSEVLQKMQSVVPALALVTYASLHGAQRRSIEQGFGIGDSGFADHTVSREKQRDSVTERVPNPDSRIPRQRPHPAERNRRRKASSRWARAPC